jgi:Short C-terminal domain
MSADVTSRLGELGKLHEQGVLTDSEFSQAKAKLLGL